MDNKKTILLTGATGLVGSYLLKILLQRGYKVYAIARSKDNKNARDRVIDILKFWDNNILSRKSHNLAVLEGDITKKNLGLDKQNIDLLKNEIEEVFQCAAITQFNWPLKEIREVNVGGTKNVLELALKCNEKGRLKKVNHLSTAYVCGDHKGIFKEEDLDVGQKFNTTYEQSKFEAEKLVEVYRRKGLWVDIFRPPVVGPESTTGRTFTFQAFHQMLHLWYLELFDVFPGKEIFLHLTPVDILSKSVVTITSNNILRNQNYHPFNTERISLSDILDISSKFLRFKKPRLVIFNELENFGLSYAQKKLLEVNISFLNRRVILYSIKTVNVLKNYNFIFPPFKKEMVLKTLSFFKERVVKKSEKYS